MRNAQFKPKFKHIDIKSKLEKLLAMVEQQAEMRKVDLLLDCDDITSSRKVSADKERINQVTLNLVSNALKFTRNGSITVNANVSTETRDISELSKDPEFEHVIPVPPEAHESLLLNSEAVPTVKANVKMLTISVTDTGCGMEPEEKDKLFQEFSCLKSNMNLNPNGVGLGLFIAKKIVGNLHGEIWVDSELGKGSTFSFKMPIGYDIQGGQEEPEEIYRTE